jgi:hypothetical protein
LALIDTIRANPHGRVPALQVVLGHRTVDASWVLEASCSYAVSQMVSSGSVTLTQLPDWYAGGEDLEIWAGWNGEVECIFKGQVLDDGARLENGVWTLSAQGPMARAEQAPGVGGLAWSVTEGKTIIGDCLTAAGITDYDLSAGWATFGTVEDVVLAEGKSYASLINDIDDVERCYTCDGPGGRVYRVQMNKVPSASAAFAFVEGVDLFGDPSRDRTISGIRNRVVVEGHPDASVLRSRQAPSPYVSGYVQYKTSSALVDTDAMADEVARLWMLELNRRVEKQSFDLLGNPYVVPGQTDSILAPGFGIDVATNYFVTSVSHKVNASGYMTDVQVEGGVGDAGYSTGSPPIADFTLTLERESFPGEGTLYFAFCVSAARDYDDAPDTLTLAWSNSANADVGSETRYVTWFTASELAAGQTITLSVTDPAANEDHVSKAITSTTTQVIRDYYHAFAGRAEASDDGGLTWQTWTPAGATVISTPRHPAQGTGLFGLSDGRLVSTSDYLRTAPTLVHTFAAAINCIWVYYGSQSEWWVGLANGNLWRTLNGGTDWTLVHDDAAAITDIHRGWDGLVRYCAGQNEYIARPPYTTWIVLTSFQTQAMRVAIGDAMVRGNEYAPDHWVCGIGTDDIAVRQEGLTGGSHYPPEMPGLASDVADVRAITQDAGRPRIHMIVRDGRVYRSDYTTSRQAAIAATSVPGSTTINYSMNDDTLTGLLLACDEATGLWKSPDSGDRWLQFRAASGALHSKMVGQSAASWVVAPATGARVLASGLVGTAPAVWWCGDVFAPTPSWTAISTGLPGSGTAYDVRLDPTSNGRAYVRVDSAIYYASDWQTAGSWTSVLSVAQARALVVAQGIPDGDISAVTVDAYDVAAGGAVYAYIHAVSLGVFGLYVHHTFWAARSTNQGSTWTIQGKVEDDDALMLTPTSVSRIGLTCDPLSAAVLWYITSDTWGTGAVYLYKSVDSGATWGSPVVAGTYTPLLALARTAPSGASPSGLYVPAYYGGAGSLYHVVSGAMTAFGNSTPILGAVALWGAPKDNLRFAVELAGSYKITTDGGATWVAAGSTPRGAHATAIWQPASSDMPRYYGAGSNSAGNGAAAWYSADLVNLTSVGDPTWGTNVDLYGLAVDPRG